MPNFRTIQPRAEVREYYQELLAKYKSKAAKKSAITRAIKDEQSDVDSMKQCLRGKHVGHYHGDLITVAHIDAAEWVVRYLNNLYATL